VKICDITHFYANSSGGVKTYLLAKAGYIKQFCAHDHVLILPARHNRIELCEGSLIYFVKSPVVPFCKPYRGIVNQAKVKSILMREHPDLVEIGSPYMIPGWIKNLQPRLGYKTVGFYHANIERIWLAALRARRDYEPVCRLAREYIRRTYANMDAVVTPSRYIERYLNRLNIANTRTVHLGVDVDRFNTARPEGGFRAAHGIAAHKVILLYVGRFAQEKRVGRLLELCAELDRHRPDLFHLVLVGGGPQWNAIRREGRRNVTVLPYCHGQHELAAIYNAADIFVTASDAETFGLALLEAQSCGLPVVAFRSTSIPEIVYSRHLLADSGEEFIGSIMCAAASRSPGLRAATRQFIIDHFSWQKTFQNLFAVYQDLNADNALPRKPMLGQCA